jgi:hypothetical protein
MSVCQSCGWYASLGMFVELDQEWEEQVGGATTDSRRPQASHLSVWINLLPWYGWLTIFLVLSVLAESVVVRLVLAENALRTTWSLAQLAVGAMVLASCHIIHFLALSSDDSSTGLLDFVLKPLRIWLYAARQLPKKLLFFDGGLIGLAAVIGSLAIIGAIPYERLLDWGIKERPKPNLMGAVMEQAAKHAKDDDMSMEEAIEELAGNAGVDDLNLDDESQKPEPKQRQQIDCVILGYRADEQGHIHTLILAAEHKGKLNYSGRVQPELDEATNAELLEQLQAARMTQPFLPIQLTAIWVRPYFTCRVSYTERTGDGRLEEVEWTKLLGKIKVRRR